MQQSREFAVATGTKSDMVSRLGTIGADGHLPVLAALGRINGGAAPPRNRYSIPCPDTFAPVRLYSFHIRAEPRALSLSWAKHRDGRAEPPDVRAVIERRVHRRCDRC
jgi:hypothetical protein